MPSSLNFKTSSATYQAFCDGSIDESQFLSAMYAFSKGANDDYVACMTDYANTIVNCEALHSLVTDDSTSRECKTMAFYALCIHYRRRRDFSQFKAIIKETASTLNKEPLYRFEEMVSLKTGTDNPEDDYPRALAIWDELDSAFKQQPAAIQAYADTIALCFERRVFSVDKPSDMKRLSRTLSMLDNASARQDYPKFHATKARLYSIQKEYGQATAQILTAIDMEDSTIEDYSLRIIEYQAILSRIETDSRYDSKLKEIEKHNAELVQIRQDIERTKYDSLAFLGFFAALLAFIMGAFELMPTASNFKETAQTILLLAGSIVVAFAAFGFLLPGNSVKATLCMAGMGIAIAVCALIGIPLLVV